MSPNMGPTQLQGTPNRRSSQSKTPKRFKERSCGSPTKQQQNRTTNGFSPNPSKQLQRSSPTSAFHTVKASTYNNGLSPMNFNKRSSPFQTRCSPQGFQMTEESKLRESPSYAGAKFSEAPPPDCLPFPPVGWVQSSSILPHSPVSFRQMENNLKTMLKVAS